MRKIDLVLVIAWPCCQAVSTNKLAYHTNCFLQQKIKYHWLPLHNYEIHSAALRERSNWCCAKPFSCTQSPIPGSLQEIALSNILSGMHSVHAVQKKTHTHSLYNSNVRCAESENKIYVWSILTTLRNKGTVQRNHHRLRNVSHLFWFFVSQASLNIREVTIFYFRNILHFAAGKRGLRSGTRD